MVNKRIIEEWMVIAKEDFELATHLIEEAWFYRQALSHLQQAVEKYTKAFLISKDWELRKIHDLETLFDEASEYESLFKNYLDFGRELTAYYTETRYPPLLDSDVSKKDAERLLKIAKEFVEKIKSLL